MLQFFFKQSVSQEEMDEFVHSKSAFIRRQKANKTSKKQ